MIAPPTGTVTFLFTDVEGSTRLWEEFPDAMRGALARHDALVQDVVATHDGYLVKTTGDGVHAAFATARSAIDAALDAQLALMRESWGDTGPLQVRMGLHTGASELRGGDYYGSAVNRRARLMSVAHGGQVVCSQATADLVRDDLEGSARLTDLGEHRLRDLGTPERVFQVTHRDLPADFPPLRSLDSFPGNLPLQLSAFVGRDDELASVCALLERERLVTLTGTGGVGKTRLALQTAAAVLPHYPDGAWFVDLAAVGDPDFVAAEIATTMGLPESSEGEREEALVGALTHRHTLVVLDNCEHVVDMAAHVADLVVRRCASVTVLATSQEALGVDGEAIYALRPLPASQASRLFTDRAAAVRHEFERTADNAATIDELCTRLDGIPLAIELAAARVASMSPAAILERLDERFRLLAHGRRTARARHQTLRATVEWSYGLLGPDEQAVFDRLSVFSGDFTPTTTGSSRPCATSGKSGWRNAANSVGSRNGTPLTTASWRRTPRPISCSTTTPSGWIGSPRSSRTFARRSPLLANTAIPRNPPSSCSRSPGTGAAKPPSAKGSRGSRRRSRSTPHLLERAPRHLLSPGSSPST